MRILKIVNHNKDTERRGFLFLFSRQGKEKTPAFRVRAFSIVEVMIATAIVTIGLIAILQLLSSSLNNSFRDIDSIVAVELAQEGLEYVFNARDNNLANGRPAFPTSGDFRFPGTTLRDFCGPDIDHSTFILDGDDRNCFSDSGSPQSRYSLNRVGNFYRFQDAITYFARVVVVDLNNIPNPTSALATSIVWWGQSSDRPDGVFTGPDADDINVAQCNIMNQCVYIQAVLTDWTP